MIIANLFIAEIVSINDSQNFVFHSFDNNHHLKFLKIEHFKCLEIFINVFQHSITIDITEIIINILKFMK
jgi:hypothetical protein